MKPAKKIVITGTFLILAALQLGAQIPNSMFFLPNVPQSNRINPSIQPGCGFYLGMPGLAPLRFQVSSSSLAFKDVIYYNSDIDSMITFLHPLADQQAFLDNLEPVNFLMGKVGTSLASFGFRAGKSFFSFDITPRVDGTLFYPKGLAELPINGLPNGSVLSLTGMGVDLTLFNEVSLGWSRKDFVLSNLDIGVRGKLLLGMANITTTSSTMDLTTSRDVWNLDASMEFNAGAPSFISFSESDSSILPDINMDSTYFDNTPYGQMARDLLLNNIGFGVDIGINYQPIPQLVVSASLLDLGYINWGNSVSGNVNFAYDFRGIDVNPFTGVDTTFIQEIQDSLMSSMNITTGNPYMSKLNPKLFIGASFYPIEKIGIGLLSRTDFLGAKVTQQFTASANMTTGRFINLSLSYTYMTTSVKNIGAGVSFNVGPLNMYIISDNIVSDALWPTEAQSINLWFGMNLCFGYRLEKKAPPPPRDRPLIL